MMDNAAVIWAASGVLAASILAVIKMVVEWHARVADRRAEAISELTDYLFGEVLLASTPELFCARAARRIELNVHYVRALGLLPRRHQHVARWANQQRMTVMAIVNLVPEEAIPGPVWGPEREKASKAAADTVQELISWQRGDIRTRRFRDS